VTDDNGVLSRVRTYLLAIVAFGSAGMGVELLLLGHVEGIAQWIPVALLAVGCSVLVWHGRARSAASARALQITMVLFVVSGVAGVVLHYRGNVAFELEMYPTMAGTELVARTLTGATPVLAPGSMALLGLVGVMSVYRVRR
jgi:hypothetical protein